MNPWLGGGGRGETLDGGPKWCRTGRVCASPRVATSPAGEASYFPCWQTGSYGFHHHIVQFVKHTKMRTAALMMMASLTPMVVGVPADVVTNDIRTCNTDADCRTFGATAATCATDKICATASCTYYGAGAANVLRTCASSPTGAETVTLYYILNNVAGTGATAARVINCDNAGTFTAPYDALIKGTGVMGGFSTAEKATIDIVHICNKPTTGAHTLRTSIKVTVQITNLISTTASVGDLYRKLGANLNTVLAASSDTNLNHVGIVDTLHTITDKAAPSYCAAGTSNAAVTLPFANNFLAATGDDLCKIVQCNTGYTFDRSLAIPTCEGPGQALSNAAATCTTNAHCQKYGQTGGVCDSTTTPTYKCTVAGAGTTACTFFAANNQELPLCAATVAPAAQKIILYYILRNTNMVGASARTVDCTKVAEFTAKYDTLIKGTTALGRFTTVEAATANIVHSCITTGTVHSLRTSIKVEVSISNLLGTTWGNYANLALNINQLLATSTDAALNAVGGVATVHLGTEDAYKGLCPVTGNDNTKVPMSTTPVSPTAANRGCTVVACNTGYEINTSGACVVTSTPTPTTTATPGTTGVATPLTFSFDATAEIAVLAASTASFRTTAATALGGTATCVSMCPTAGGRCYTCAGVIIGREASVLVAAKYRVNLSGTTNHATTANALTALNTALRALFAANTAIVYSDNSVLVFFTSDSDDGLSGGAIAGIVIGCVAFVVIVVVIVYCLCCKAAPESDSADSDSDAKKETNPDQV